MDTTVAWRQPGGGSQPRRQNVHPRGTSFGQKTTFSHRRREPVGSDTTAIVTPVSSRTTKGSYQPCKSWAKATFETRRRQMIIVVVDSDSGKWELRVCCVHKHHRAYRGRRVKHGFHKRAGTSEGVQPTRQRRLAVVNTRNTRPLLNVSACGRGLSSTTCVR